VVAKHYSGVSMAALHVERVTEPRSAYMSYRINDRIYWTKYKLQLLPGETILTDGETTIRGRCGNGVSDVAMLPVSAQEPEAAAFDRRSDNPVSTALAGLWDAGNNGLASNTDSGVAGMGSGSGANGSTSPQLMARNDVRSAGGGVGGFVGSGGGGLPVPSSYVENNGARSTTRSSSRAPEGDDAATPGGGDGSTSPGGGAGSNPPGGGGGSNPPGGHNGGNAPGGGDGSHSPGNSGGPTNRSGGGGPDTFAFGAPNGNPSGDPQGGDVPPDVNQVAVNGVEASDSVPEPSSILLLAGGMTGYALKRIRARRRRN
jgi:hypothetical protein